MSPEYHSEKTPVGALVLHLISCIVLIFATFSERPEEAYTLLTSLTTYVVYAFIGAFLGLGILILRLRGPPATAREENAPATARGEDIPGDNQPKSPTTWAEMTGKKFHPLLSIVCAIVYTCGGLYPVATTWVPPSQYSDQTVKPWWLVPVVAWIIIGVSIVWFVGFVLLARRIEKKDHCVFVVEKKPMFEPADGSSRSLEAGHSGGGLIQVHETVYLSWVGKEALRRRPTVLDSPREADGYATEVPAAPYTSTDFAAFMLNQGAEKGKERLS